MRPAAGSRRDRVRAMLADLKMPGALEAADGILARADGGSATAAEAIEELLAAQIALRNNRRLDSAMRSSRLPAVKTLAQFAFQPSRRRCPHRLRTPGLVGYRVSIHGNHRALWADCSLTEQRYSWSVGPPQGSTSGG